MTGEAVTVSDLALALKLARSGIAIVPLHTITGSGCSCEAGEWCPYWAGHPRSNLTASDASTDPAVLRAWWSRWPDARPGRSMPGGGFEVVPESREPEFAVDPMCGQLELLEGQAP